MKLRILAALAAGVFLTAAGCNISIRTAKVADGGPFRSEDGGLTWIQVANAGADAKGRALKIDNVNVQYFRFDPTNSATVYLATAGSGIYRSDDGGANWVRTGIPSGSYSSFAIDPTTSSIMYAASGGTITKSSDGGATWSPIYFESFPGRAITDLAITPTTTKRVLASTSTGDILVSDDYGNTWRLFSNLGVASSVTRMFYAPGSSTVLYALLANYGLYRSNDGGASWASLMPGLAAFPNATTITSIATLPSKPDTLYLGTGYGLLMTSDGGASWTPIQNLVPLGSQPIQLVAVNPENPKTVYVIVGNRLRKSEDGGVNWDAKITVPTSRLITTMILTPDDPNHLFIGTVKPAKR